MSLLMTAIVAPYLAPTGVAVYRNHRDTKALFLINLFLGWTGVGWIATMIWACTGETAVQEVATRGDRLQSDGRLRLQGGDPRLDERPPRLSRDIDQT